MWFYLVVDALDKKEKQKKMETKKLADVEMAQVTRQLIRQKEGPSQQPVMPFDWQQPCLRMEVINQSLENREKATSLLN